jgi:hypothetical protein
LRSHWYEWTLDLCEGREVYWRQLELAVASGELLIVLAFVLKATIPLTYRLGLGAYFHRLDSIAFWVLLMAGLILGVIAVLKIIMCSDAV